MRGTLYSIYNKKRFDTIEFQSKQMGTIVYKKDTILELIKK